MLEVINASNDSYTATESKPNRKNLVKRDFFKLVNEKDHPENKFNSMVVNSESSMEFMKLNSSANNNISIETEITESLGSQVNHLGTSNEGQFDSNFGNFLDRYMFIGSSLGYKKMAQLYPYTLIATGNLEQIIIAIPEAELFKEAQNVNELVKNEFLINYEDGNITNSMVFSSVKYYKFDFKGVGLYGFNSFCCFFKNTSNELSTYQLTSAPILQTNYSLSFRKLTYVRQTDGSIKVVLRDYRIDQEKMKEWYDEMQNKLKSHAVYTLNGVNYLKYSILGREIS